LDKQVEAELTAVRDFLDGRSNEVNLIEATEVATRRSIVEELLAAMSRAASEESTAQTESGASDDTEATTASDAEAAPPDQPESKRIDQEKLERARKLFMDHGYFDEVVQDLRGAISPQQRAAAARALGMVGNKRGTPHLLAAMFDDDPEVRNAAEESMIQMSGSTVFSKHGNALSDLEQSDTDVSAAVAHDETASRRLGVEDYSEQNEGELEPQKLFLDADTAEKSSDTQSALSLVDDFDGEVQQPTNETGQESDRAPLAMGYETERYQRANSEESINDQEALKDPEQLLLEEQSLRETVKQLDRRLLDAAAVRAELEKEAVLSVERETRLRAEASARIRQDEERRKQADEEGERRRSKEFEALAAEQVARAQAEAEAHRIAEEESRMRLETSNLRRATEELVWQRIGIETQRREAAETARRDGAKRSRDESEKLHNAELARLRSEEEALRSATEEAARRRAEVENAHKGAKAELERLTQERVQLAATEAFRHAEATRLRQEAKTRHDAEVTRLSSEEEALRAEAEKVSRRRAEVGAAHQEANIEIERLNRERAQLAAAEAARRAEAERIREAEERNHADHEQLRLELDGLRLVTEEVTTRRAEVEAARKKADEEAERLLEAQVRIRAEEEASARAEAERMQLEADLHERVKTQQRLLEETRRRASEEEQRLEEETRRQTEHEEKRRAELQLLQKNAEVVAQRRVEEEKHILGQVDSLRIADAEARKRIEEAEARRRKSEDVYRLVAEKVQRVEAEAHLRALEEQKILAKLESVRRSAAVEAQARAEQEKRIKEEIELFRKLEEVDRPRLEVSTLQRKEAQANYQQHKDRIRANAETRARTGDPQNVLEVSPQASATQESSTSRQIRVDPEYSSENLETPLSAETDDDQGREAGSVEGGSAPAAASAIHSYLNSVDPYKRAAAVSELARSNEKDAFDLIAKCFDDHSSHVRNAAARGLLKVNPVRTVELFNRVLEDGPEDRRRKIGNAIAASGLAAEAIDNLVSDNREDTYNALSILFVMAKTGEVQPLVQAITEHPNGEVSEAAIKLLTLSGKSEIASAALKQRANAGARGTGQ
jgi:hypothetical protein